MCILASNWFDFLPLPVPLHLCVCAPACLCACMCCMHVYVIWLILTCKSIWYWSCIYRTLVKCLNPLLRMTSHLMNTANWWKRMAHGLDIWNYKQLLLLRIVIYVFTGWDSPFHAALICVLVSILMELLVKLLQHYYKLIWIVYFQFQIVLLSSGRLYNWYTNPIYLCTYAIYVQSELNKWTDM